MFIIHRRQFPVAQIPGNERWHSWQQVEAPMDGAAEQGRGAEGDGAGSLDSIFESLGATSTASSNDVAGEAAPSTPEMGASKK